MTAPSRVAAADGVAQVTPTDADADLAPGIEELGMLYLGGVRPTVLRQAGASRNVGPVRSPGASGCWRRTGDVTLGSGCGR